MGTMMVPSSRVSGTAARNVRQSAPTLIDRDSPGAAIESSRDFACLGARIAVDDKKARRRLYDKTGRTEDYLRTMERLGAVAGLADDVQVAVVRAPPGEVDDETCEILQTFASQSSLALVNALGIKHGFAFSAGAIDYVLNFGLATRPWLLLP